MTYLLIRHKVADYAKWKASYDGHFPARQQAGLKEKHLLRSLGDPNEVVMLFEAHDIEKAQAFIDSDDLREAMKNAGVINKPDLYFLA